MRSSWRQGPARRPVIPTRTIQPAGPRSCPLARRFSGPPRSLSRSCVTARTTDRKRRPAAAAPGQVLVGFLRPLGSIETVEAIAPGRHLVLRRADAANDPAQSMDALSSMATISGYKAVVVAADLLPRLFPMMTTAAGTITPARVLVIGAGVAGLQAIATARRLGAVVSAYDMRPAAKEQVKSLGGRFVELPIEAQGRRGRSRLRPCPGRSPSTTPTRAAGAGRRRERRRDHGRRHPGQEIAGAGHARDGRTHGAGLGDRRPGRRARRQLRGDSPRRAGRRVRRHRHRLVQPREHRSLSRQPDVCAKPARVSCFIS